MELTPEEEAEAIKAFKQVKLREAKRKAYWQKVNDIPQPIVMDAREYHGYIDSLVRKMDVELVFDNNQKNILYGLIAHFTQNYKAPELLQNALVNKYSEHKGICLIGSTGVGKTTLMRLFQQNPYACFMYKSVKDIAFAYCSEGYDVLYKYAELLNTKSGLGTPANYFNHQLWGYLFDDIGAEITGKHFGVEIETISEIIEMRYNAELPNFYTNVTTNLTMEEIQKRYGTRLYDRFYEMFNIIVYDGESKRL